MDFVKQLKCLTVINCVAVFFLFLPCGKCSQFLKGVLESYSTSGTQLEVYETHGNVRSIIECATKCLMERHATWACRAVAFNHLDRTCDFFKIGTVQVAAPGVQVYLIEVHDVFHSISVGGKQFSIYLSSVTKTFSAARAHCNQLGGYLLEFSSLEEYEAIGIVFNGIEGDIHVGVNDIQKEHEYVRDKDGLPFDPSLLLWFGLEGSFYRRDENCALLGLVKLRLWDGPCSVERLFLCERDQ